MRKGHCHCLKAACSANAQSIAKERIAKAACTERTRAKASLLSASASPNNRRRIHAKDAKKAVRFAGTVKVCVKQVSEEDLNLTWYGPREYKSFQCDSKRSLKAVTRDPSGQVDEYDPTKHCLRGLEACLSTHVYQTRKEEKTTIVNQVLQQQLLQRIMGINDQEGLASLSQGLSKSAQDRALVLAAFDSARDQKGKESTALR